MISDAPAAGTNGPPVEPATAEEPRRHFAATLKDRRQGRAFTALVDQAPDAIARLSRTGHFLYVNRVVARLFDREVGDLVGRRMDALGLPIRIVASYRRGVRRIFRTAIETSFDFSIEVDGASKHFAVRIVPELDERGQVESALAVTYDVTRRTETEKQRDALFEQEQTARSKAEAASHARDQFLAIVSHELRSPLNGIQSWSHVLENQMTGPDRANPVAMRALEGIRSGIDQQVKLIEHLLDATVAMTGDLRLVKTPMLLRESVESAITEVRSSALAKDVALHVEMELTGDRIDGDQHRVRQIFSHLLSNALKFTPRGGSIWLSARRFAGEAIVVVRDSGRGLGPGFEQWLFEPFKQADSSNTRRSGGIGLGLALARRLAEVHGGRVTADSAGPHLGSSFTVSLPLVESDDAPASIEAVAGIVHMSVELSGIHALVIDDQLEAREALSALLAQFGATVDVASSSQAGLDLIEQRGSLPDIVVCDIAMPEEDGYGFVKRLRAYEAMHPALGRAADGSQTNTPVIALSAFAEQPDRSLISGVNFDFYLAKPVHPQRLLSTLSRLASRGA